MLFETYTNLLGDFPKGCDLLFGKALASDGSLWLSVDRNAHPSLLFGAPRDEPRSDIELHSVSVWFSRECVIDAADGQSTSGIFSVIRLNDNDPDILRILFRLLEELFPESGAPYTNKQLSEKILELSNLLRQISNTDSDIVGLWGELYVLSQASNTANALRCWCQNKMAKYDFLTGDFAVEVKTTINTRRKHTFGLDQLRPDSEFNVYVASVAIVELHSGCTTAQLMDLVYKKIEDNDLRNSFFRQCLLKGGPDIYRNTLKFNVLPDGTSLAFFEASNLPVPRLDRFDPIENVRFDLDLTDLPSIAPDKATLVLSFGAR